MRSLFSLLVLLPCMGAAVCRFDVRPGDSLSEVRDRVRALPAELRAQQGVEVVLAPGDYAIPGGLELSAADCGLTDSAPVVWKASCAGEVRLLGGVSIPISMFRPENEAARRTRLSSAARDKVLVADLSGVLKDPIPELSSSFSGCPAAPVVYLNHNFGTLARWPNKGWLVFSNRVDRGVCKSGNSSSGPYANGAFVFESSRIARWDMSEGVWLNGYWTHDWHNHSVRVASWGAENGTNGVMRLAGAVPYGVLGQTWGGGGRRFYAFNVFDELDAPGEWWLDRTARRLHVFAPTGEVVVVQSQNALLRGKNLAHLRLEGLVIEYGCGPAVAFESGEDIELRNCRIVNVAGTGVVVSGRRNRIVGCEIENCGSCGVVISGGDRRTLARSDSLVESCRIHGFGVYRRTYAPGVKVEGVGITLRGNEIYDAPHSAVIYTGNEFLFEGNDVHHVLMETGDAGAFYTGRDWTTQGNVLRGNFIHELGAGTAGAKANAMGFYFDDCDCGDAVYDNVFWRCARGIMIGGGRDHPVRGNVFAECKIGLSIDDRGLTWKRLNDPIRGGASWMLEKKAEALHYREEPWRSRYPHLANIMDEAPGEPLYNPVVSNVFVDCGQPVVLSGKMIDTVIPKMEIRSNVLAFTSETGSGAGPDKRIAGGFSELMDVKGADLSDYRSSAWRNRLLASARFEGSHGGLRNEFKARDGIGNVMSKIRAGREVAIAYFGGSITAMDGWRRLSREWLAKRYPSARFREINAAIGGTGSGLGVFRLGHDVLAHSPDLVFVEFATNDRGQSKERIWENFDGIVRQIWKANPRTDIVFAYTVTEPVVGAYLAGCLSQSAAAMEELAEYYGIPTMAFGPRVAEELRSGRLVMSEGGVATPVPDDASCRGKPSDDRGKRVLFAKDGVHPTLSGHGLYLQTVQEAWKGMEGLAGVDHSAKLARPFRSAEFENAKMVPIDRRMLSGSGWSRLSDDDASQRRFKGRGGQLWEASRPGDALCFTFRGSECAIYDVIGPSGGRVWITVDGVRRSCPLQRFDSYCTYWRLSSLPVFRGTNGAHAVRIEVDSGQPDRRQVLTRAPGEDVSSPKYDGTKFIVCQIEVVGDVLDE